MADVSVKIGVDGISQFKQNMQQAQTSVKTLDAELKKSEAQYKATGDKEQYLADKSRILKQQLDQQKKAVAEGEKALKAMREQGVDQTSKSYQDLQRKLTEAETAVITTTTAINNLDGSEQQAARSADNLAGSLGGISKKMSLDQVVNGVNNITGSLERAAKAAISFATDAWGEVMKVAGYADDITTNAMKYGVTPEEYAKRANLAATWAETSAESYFEAINRIRYNLAEISAEDMGIFEAIGFNPYIGMYGIGPLKDTEDIFWGIGDALLHMEDANKRAAYSRQLFGRSWEELNPMFTMGRAEYERLYEDTPTNTDEEITRLAVFNDTIGTLRQKFQSLEVTALAALAPALTEAANAVGLFLDKLMEFLKTEDGQELLDRLGEAISGLFDDLGSIDPETVVNNLVSVFESIIGGLEWLVDNKDGVVEALKWIIGGWATLKLTGGALDILRLVDGIKTLFFGGAAKSTGGLLSKLGFGEALKGAASAALPFLAADAAVLTVGLLPAAIAQWNDEKRWTSDRERRLEAAETAGDNADFIRRMANALGPETDSSGNYVRNMFGFLNMRPTDETDDLLMGLEGRQNADRAKMMSMIRMYNPYTAGEYTGDLLQRYWAGEALDPAVVTELAQNVTDALAHEPVWISNLEVAPEAAETISEEIGEVPVEVVPHFRGRWEGYYGGGGGGAGGGLDTVMSMHANGIWAVPFDGYAAILHKNERVVPAREAGSSRNFSSNLYVESMYMNNGTDADGLAAAMAAAQRRTMRGYGS